MSHKPGGGLHSKVVKHSTNPKVEPKSRAHNPATVAQVGAHVGAHITNKSDTGYRGDPDFTGAVIRILLARPTWPSAVLAPAEKFCAAASNQRTAQQTLATRARTRVGKHWKVDEGGNNGRDQNSQRPSFVNGREGAQSAEAQC